MTNTKVTIKYSNGTVLEFSASDELEKLIETGEMFSVSAMNPEYGDAIKASKIYTGNPINALRQMIKMRSSTSQIDDGTEDIITSILDACISLLSNEIINPYSGIIHVKCDPKKCPVTNSECYYLGSETIPRRSIIFKCAHEENTQDGTCLSNACPFSTDFIPF